MTISVTLLISSGDPDPAWHLTPDQEEGFRRRLQAAPVPSVTVGPAPARKGYAGIMVRTGDGERWVVYRGWVRGGMTSHIDDGRVLEQWLLDTGAAVVPPKLLKDLTQVISPPVDPNAKPPVYE